MDTGYIGVSIGGELIGRILPYPSTIKGRPNATYFLHDYFQNGFERPANLLHERNGIATSPVLATGLWSQTKKTFNGGENEVNEECMSGGRRNDGRWGMKMLMFFTWKVEEAGCVRFVIHV